MRRKVVEIQCSRCERQEFVEESAASHDRSFKAVFGGAVVEYEDLCTPCLNTVKNSLELIAKKIEGVSPARKAGKKNSTKKKETAQPSPSSTTSSLPAGASSLERTPRPDATRTASR